MVCNEYERETNSLIEHECTLTPDSACKPEKMTVKKKETCDDVRTTSCQQVSIFFYEGFPCSPSLMRNMRHICFNQVKVSQSDECSYNAREDCRQVNIKYFHTLNIIFYISHPGTIQELCPSSCQEGNQRVQAGGAGLSLLVDTQLNWQ